MEPLNPLSYIPEEILYHCITGRSPLYLSQRDMRNFYYLSLSFKVTCTNMKARIDSCWQICFETLVADWKAAPEFHLHSAKCLPSNSLTINWICGKPQFLSQNLEDLQDKDFFLSINPEEPLGIYKIKEAPILWLNQKETRDLPLNPSAIVYDTNNLIYTSGALYGDAAFFDLKSQRLIQLIEGNIETHLIFERDLKPIYFENNAYFLFLNLENGRHYINSYQVDAEKVLLKNSVLISSDPIFQMHALNKHMIFCIKMGKQIQIRAISFKDLNTGSISHISSSTYFPGFNMLIDYKNKLLMCSMPDHTHHLCIRTIDIQDNQLHISEIKIEGLEKLSFKSFNNAFCHLDKLFITCEITAQNESKLHILIINLESQLLESKYPLGFNTVHPLRILSSSLGCIHIFLDSENSKTLKMDYTLKFKYDIS